jgi:hypothetical protein
MVEERGLRDSAGARESMRRHHAYLVAEEMGVCGE